MSLQLCAQRTVLQSFNCVHSLVCEVQIGPDVWTTACYKLILSMSSTVIDLSFDTFDTDKVNWLLPSLNHTETVHIPASLIMRYLGGIHMTMVTLGPGNSGTDAALTLGCCLPWRCFLPTITRTRWFMNSFLCLIMTLPSACCNRSRSIFGAFSHLV